MKCSSPYSALFFALLLCALPAQSKAQQKGEVLLGFVKTTSMQSSDSLYFNVLKLENISEHIAVVSPQISVPDGFSLMSRVPSKIKLPPGTTKHIPFRISISKTTFSNKAYLIEAQILSEQKELLAKTSCQVNIQARREWRLSVDETELIFSGEKNTSAEFRFRLLNSGNTQEKLKVHLEIPEGFKPANCNRKKDFTIQLPPGTDSIVHYQLVQNQKNVGLNFSENIKLQVSNDYNQYNKSIRISSYSNCFDYSPVKEKSNSYIEYSRRTINGLSEIKDELQTKGIVPLKKDNKLLFSFTNYDLSDTEEFWERSYYQLVFEGKNFSGGVGQHYSNLLLDAYNPHGIFAKWKSHPGKKNEIELYASQGLDYNITSVAAGHQLFIDKLTIKTSAGYNEDCKRKQKSKSCIFSASLPLGSKHKFNLNARGIERDYFKDSIYTQSGLQGNWSYYGKITPRLFLNLKNQFQTTGYYSGNRSENEINTALNYQVNSKSRLLIEYAYNTRKGGSSDYDLTDHLLKSALEFKTPQNQNIKTGIWLEEYRNQENERTSQVRSCNLWMETSNRRGSLSYSFSAMAGYRFQENTVFENNEKFYYEDNSPNLTVEGQATVAPFSLRCSYINGSQNSSSLSQRSDYNELRFSPAFRKELIRNKILVELQADYDLDWASQRKSINIRPKLNMQLKNDWSLVMDAYISAYGEQSVSFSGDDFNTNFRISLRKDFNIGNKRTKEKYHKMEMVFFRDENKNSLMDKNEKGIEKSLVSIDKKRESSDEKYLRLSKLVSQNDGKVSYKNLPEGNYDLDVHQLASTGSYFNFEGSKQKIKLNKDTTCFIPYIKAYKVEGKLDLKKSGISSGKVEQISNIKVTATDSHGKIFSCLTSSNGSYQLPVAGKDKYIVSIHNPYGNKIEVNNNNAVVDFLDAEVETVNFEFVEKRRKVNMKSSSSDKSTVAGRNSKLPEKTNSTSKTSVPTKHTLTKVPSLNTEKEHPISTQAPISTPFHWIYQHYNEEAGQYENYSVVGAFQFKNNAENYAKELQNKNLPAFLFYNNQKNLYYVYIYKKVVAKEHQERP